MADTGEDDEVTLDTLPICGAACYVVGHDEVAPGTLVHYATDGDARVPAQSIAHAQALADMLTCAALEYAAGAHGWRSVARRIVMAAMRWLNRTDPKVTNHAPTSSR